MFTCAAVNVVATLVAIVGVDRVGRRFLFIASGILMVMCEIIVGVCLGHFFHANHGVLPDNVSNGILAVICIYVANFAWSWGQSFLLAPNTTQSFLLASDSIPCPLPSTGVPFAAPKWLCLDALPVLDSTNSAQSLMPPSSILFETDLICNLQAPLVGWSQQKSSLQKSGLLECLLPPPQTCCSHLSLASASSPCCAT